MSFVAIAMISTLFSCVDSGKDLYDPSFQMPNPMGDGFAAPDGFDWSTMSNVQVKVEVNAQSTDEYYYVVELYDTNPIISSDAHLLDRGVAKGNQPYTSEISISNAIQTIFVKEITPTGLSTVKAADITNGAANCSFKTSDLSPRSRSFAVATTSAANEPDEDDASLFPIECPDGIAEFNNNSFSANTSYKVTASTTKINLGDKINIKLYVTEDITLAEDPYFTAGTCLYILPGKTVTVPKTTRNGQTNSMITIGKGASLVVNGLLKMDSNFKVYNLGILDAKEVEYTNQSYIYNGYDGIINIEGTIHGQNADSYFINNGIINANKIFLQGNSNFINQNKVTVTDDTTIDCTTASWENAGEWVTNDMSMIAWNGNSLNRCKLIVKNNLKVSAATLTNDGGAYVQCKTLYMNNGTVQLGSKALFEVTEEATYGYQLPGQGFIGTGTEKALIVIEKAVAEIMKGNLIHYSGNIQIICPIHPAEKKGGEICWTLTNGAEWAEKGSNTVSIPKSECNNGYDGGTPTPPKNPDFPIIVDDSQNYTYLFEDQWPIYGDYDMNDAVITIKNRKIYTNEANKVEEFRLSIDLRATGATKNIGAAIMFDEINAGSITQAIVFDNNSQPTTFNLNSQNIENGQDKVVVPLFDDAHVALGSNKYEPINTISGSPNNTNNVKNISFSIKFENPTLSADAFNINKLNTFIIVGGNKNNRREIHVIGFQPTKLAETAIFGSNNDDSSLSGKRYYISKENLAWGIMVPTDFRWPREYVNIQNAYPQFAGWVTSGGQENKDWWSQYDASKVFDK